MYWGGQPKKGPWVHLHGGHTVRMLHDQRITLPLVTRGQVALNTLVSLAEMTYVVDGKGFAENGQAPGDDGSWLRLTERIQRDAGKGAVGKGKGKQKGRSQKEKAMVAGLSAILGRLSMVTGAEVEKAMMAAGP